MIVALTTDDVSTRLAHERLSKAAAGRFTVGLIESWRPSEANCAAAAMERANSLKLENDRLRAALEEIAHGEGYYGAQAREYKDIAKAALAPRQGR